MSRICCIDQGEKELNRQRDSMCKGSRTGAQNDRSGRRGGQEEGQSLLWMNFSAISRSLDYSVVNGEPLKSF